MAEPVQTEMRLSNATEWSAIGHVAQSVVRECGHRVPRAQISVRRVGWLDQKGFVWMSSEDWRNAGGPNGSITPLLIAAECD